MSAHNPILPWMHDCAREVARKHGAAPDSPYAMTVAATIADFAPIDAYQIGVETERARCKRAVMGLSVPHCFSARELIDADALAAPQPLIYPIAEREPEFDRLTGMCWMWNASPSVTIEPGTPCGWQRMKGMPGYDRFTHWSPDGPRPPSVNPSST